MNSRSLVVQLALFLVIALGCGYYVATSVLGPRAFGDSVNVSVRMRQAAGLSEGARVTYRGLDVGTVDDVRVASGGAGVVLRLTIEPGRDIPADSAAVVTANSPLGIAHLDIRPRSTGGPYLTDSSTIGPADVTRPPPLERVLVDFTRLAEGLSPEDVDTLTKALRNGLRDTGPELGTLLDNAGSLLGAADNRLGQLRDTAEHARELVDSANASGGLIRELAASMRELTGGLREMEPAIRDLVHRLPEPTRKAADLMAQGRSSVSTLLGNLVSTSRIVSVRGPALEQALTALPHTLRELSGIVEGDTAHFYLVGTQGPVCYYETERRTPTATEPRDPRLNWRCPASESTLQQRGAVNAPRPDSAAPPVGQQESRPDEQASPLSSTASPARPLPFEVTPRVLGPSSWSAVLVRGVN